MHDKRKDNVLWVCHELPGNASIWFLAVAIPGAGQATSDEVVTAHLAKAAVLIASRNQ
jgi:hypothetical protein